MRKLELDEHLSTTSTLPKQSPSPDDLASQAEIDFFLQRLGPALLDRGYDKGGGEALGGLVRLVKRTPLVTKDELKMLQGVLSALLLIPRKKVE
jgi:tRNA C32,U32 (ribose-2'-O)-methylase TrmJ